MSNWTNYNDIKKVLNQKWDKGYILKSAFIEDDFFPLSITIKGPNAKDFEQLPEIIKWIKDLSKYENISLQNKEINSRVHGENSVPAYAVIENISNAVQIIKKQKELKNFLYNANILVSKFPNLQNWIVKKAIKVSEIEDVNSLVKVLNWFLNTNDTNMYLREICIEGMHTKFIERNKTIISEMLDEILPKEKVNFEVNKFEDRYNLKSEEVTVRFRIVDDNFSLCGLNDIRVPLSAFAKLDLKVENVFFTENLTNFLSFPNKKSSIVVFAKGYFVDILKTVKWFNSKNLYYWGDIDTHGFNILSMARGNFQSIKSILMTEEILLNHKLMWVKEDKPFAGQVHNLTSEELSLYTKLKNNFHGENVRLEQELIEYKYIENLQV